MTNVIVNAQRMRGAEEGCRKGVKVGGQSYQNLDLNFYMYTFVRIPR